MAAKAFFAVWFAYLSMIVVAFVGYFMNIVSLVHLIVASGPITMMFVARVVGIIVFPLGAALGYF